LEKRPTNLNVYEKKEKAMVSKTKMCPSGHVIPAESVTCPICHPSSIKRTEGFNAPSALTRVDFDSEATRAEELGKTLLEEARPFGGWLAITDGNLSGEAFHLYEGRNIIGSSSPCDIPIPDEGIENRHLSIRFSSGKCTLTDLDTDEGTYLNGKRIYRAELKDGDHIRIGKANLRIKIL
jgi:hypothetical protein